MTINFIRKISISICLLLSSISSFGQVKQAILGINGLTCSLCSRSVEMQLNKLDFIQNIDMSLSETEAILTFKDKKRIDWKKIPKAVEDAGFSIRSLSISVDLSEIDNNEDHCFLFQNQAFQLINGNFTEGGIKIFQIMNKGFMPRRIFSKVDIPNKQGCSSRTTYYLSEK